MTTIKNDVEYNHLQTLDSRIMRETKTITLNGSLSKENKETREMFAAGIKLTNL